MVKIFPADKLAAVIAGCTTVGSDDSLHIGLSNDCNCVSFKRAWLVMYFKSTAAEQSRTKILTATNSAITITAIKIETKFRLVILIKPNSNSIFSNAILHAGPIISPTAYEDASHQVVRVPSSAL